MPGVAYGWRGKQNTRAAGVRARHSTGRRLGRFPAKAGAGAPTAGHGVHPAGERCWTAWMPAGGGRPGRGGKLPLDCRAAALLAITGTVSAIGL